MIASMESFKHSLGFSEDYPDLDTPLSLLVVKEGRIKPGPEGPTGHTSVQEPLEVRDGHGIQHGNTVIPTKLNGKLGQSSNLRS
jgi:hypothetical protein